MIAPAFLLSSFSSPDLEELKEVFESQHEELKKFSEEIEERVGEYNLDEQFHRISKYLRNIVKAQSKHSKKLRRLMERKFAFLFKINEFKNLYNNLDERESEMAVYFERANRKSFSAFEADKKVDKLILVYEHVIEKLQKIIDDEDSFFSDGSQSRDIG